MPALPYTLPPPNSLDAPAPVMDTETTALPPGRSHLLLQIGGDFGSLDG